MNDKKHDSKINESPDLNDPVLVAFRAAKMNREKELAKPKRKPLYGKQRQRAEDVLWNISRELKELYAERGQILIDMEQEAEIEGGSIANEYGDRLNKIEDRIQKLLSNRKQLEMKLAESKEIDESCGCDHSNKQNLKEFDLTDISPAACLK
jgi:DNA mismatch repair ATPase MutS